MQFVVRPFLLLLLKHTAIKCVMIDVILIFVYVGRRLILLLIFIQVVLVFQVLMAVGLMHIFIKGSFEVVAVIGIEECGILTIELFLFAATAVCIIFIGVVNVASG